LHEIKCKELNSRCEICNEIVNKYEIEEHNDEFHSLVDCLDCGRKLEKRILETHKKKCLNKPSNCHYCDLKIGKSELHEHEYICGSKTEKCMECGKYVQIRGIIIRLIIEKFNISILI